jgi:hypothetical protein
MPAERPVPLPKPHPATVNGTTTRPAHPARVVQQKAPHSATIQRNAARPALLGTTRAAHPATTSDSRSRLELRAAPAVPSSALQRMQAPLSTATQTSADFSDLLKIYSETPSSENPSALIISSSLDSDHTKLFNSAKTAYKGRKCKVLNKTEIVYDAGNQALPAAGTELKAALKLKLGEAKRIILVLASHGNVQWLFGDDPGAERQAVKHFAAALKQWMSEIDEALSVSKLISMLVLDACWSATELRQRINLRVSNDCPARLVSSHWTQIPIFGFNGIAEEGKVGYFTSPTSGKIKRSYGMNVVIFKGGNVIKGSSPDNVLWHATTLMKRDFYTNELFSGQLPDFFESTSF